MTSLGAREKEASPSIISRSYPSTFPSPSSEPIPLIIILAPLAADPVDHVSNNLSRLQLGHWEYEQTPVVMVSPMSELGLDRGLPRLAFALELIQMTAV